MSTTGKDGFAPVLGKVLDRTLSPADVGAAFEEILAGRFTAVQVGAFAACLRMMGETPEMIVAAARALRGSMIPVEHGLLDVADTCGTGGDGASTINVSTAAAFVLASLGVRVAKHGNRSVSSQCGSADVIVALGGKLDVPPATQARILHETSFCFLFAPHHHPALKHAAAARRELGIRTIFNALGPLANPARADHQLVGVYADELRPVLARALADLGVTRAWVVRSTDGLDEVSPEKPTRVSVLRDGVVTEREVSPTTFGAKVSPAEHASGGTAEENARGIVAILRGEPHPARAAVHINAAAALAVARDVSPEEAFAAVARALESGAPFTVLERWRRAIAGAAPGEP